MLITTEAQRTHAKVSQRELKTRTSPKLTEVEKMKQTVVLANIMVMSLAASIACANARAVFPRIIDELKLPVTAGDSDGQSAKVVVKDPWLQESPPGQTITAAYMRLENHGSSEAVLVSASTSVARVVEIHKVVVEDGLMKMRKLDQLVIPANASLELKPGGFHLMVIGVNKDLKEGDEAKLVLKFADNTEKTIVVPVKQRSPD